MSLESARRWRLAHPEENRDRTRDWYNANPDRAIARSSAWKRKHRARYNARRRELYRQQHPRRPCTACGKPLERGQRIWCRRDARLAKLEATQDWRSRRAA